MKITLAQLNPTVGDLRTNAETILRIATQAATEGIALVLTPELSLCGYPPRDLLLKPAFIDEMRSQLNQLATELPKNVAVLVGFAECNSNAAINGEKPLYNSIALLQDHQVKQIFRKRLRPTYDVFDEARYFQPGHVPNHFVSPRILRHSRGLRRW